MNTIDRAATFTRLDGAQFGPMDDLEPILERINSPAQVRALSRAQLKLLAAELREFLLRSVASTGGHLSSNLGTVELTVAIHHVFSLQIGRAHV